MLLNEAVTHYSPFPAPPLPSVAVSRWVRGQVLQVAREKEKHFLSELGFNHQLIKLAARPHGHFLRADAPWIQSLVAHQPAGALNPTLGASIGEGGT